MMHKFQMDMQDILLTEVLNITIIMSSYFKGVWLFTMCDNGKGEYEDL